MKELEINHIGNPTLNIKGLKDEIREVVRKWTKVNEDIHISVVSYEVHTYKKWPKGKKK